MIEKQPTFRRFDWDWASADFCRFPRLLRAHYKAMTPPMYQVGTVAKKYVAEGCMARVARTRKHDVITADLAWEQYAVSVIREQRVLDHFELSKIGCPAYANGRSVITVAPRDEKLASDLSDAWIVTVLRRLHTCWKRPFDRCVLDAPVYAVVRESCMQAH